MKVFFPGAAKFSGRPFSFGGRLLAKIIEEQKRNEAQAIAPRFYFVR
jgi:hypothetical protein